MLLYGYDENSPFATGKFFMRPYGVFLGLEIKAEEWTSEWYAFVLTLMLKDSLSRRKFPGHSQVPSVLSQLQPGLLCS